MSKKETKSKKVSNNTPYYIGVETLDIAKPNLKKIYTKKKIDSVIKLLEEIAKYEEYYKEYSQASDCPQYQYTHPR